MREIGAEDKGDITDINDEHKGNVNAQQLNGLIAQQVKFEG